MGRRLCLALALVLGIATAAAAQHQRLGLVPQEVVLAPVGAGASKIAEGFCLDEHLFAPTSPTPYRHVLSENSATVEIAGQGRIPLQAAIERGLIDVSGNELNLRFINKSGRAANISIASPTAFGEVPQAWVTDRVLAAIGSKSQKDIWLAGSDERRLKAFAYISTAASEAEYHAGIVRFQQDHKLAATGKVDASTSRALVSLETATERRLAAVGFKSDLRGVDNTATFSDSMRDYQRFHGVAPSGVFDNAAAERLRSDETKLAQIRKLKPTDHPNDLLRSASTVPDVLTFQHLDGATGALVRGLQGVEFWALDDSGVERSKGRSAIVAFEGMAMERALRASVEATVVVQPLPRLDGNAADLAIDGEPADLGAGDLSAFLLGTKDIADLSLAIEIAGKAAGGRAKVIVARSRVLQARLAQVGPSSLKALGITYSKPESIARSIAKQYGIKVDVFVANDIEKAVSNATSLPAFSKGSQLRVYVDGQKIKDYGAIQNIRPDLRDAHVEVLDVGDHGSGQPNVVLFAGHNDANLRDAIAALGVQGAFKNRIVALAVCGQGGEMAFNTRLIREAGAKAVLFYDVTINAQAVEDVMLKFAQLLMREGLRESDFQRLWDRSVDEVIQRATATEVGELLKLKTALFQVAGTFARVDVGAH